MPLLNLTAALPLSAVTEFATHLPAALPIIATLLAVASGIPQLILMLRTRSAAGVSIAGWGTSAAASGVWVAYSVAQGALVTALVTALPALVTCGVLVLAISWGGDRRWPSIPFVMIATIILVAALRDAGAMTMILATTALWSYAPSIYSMWTAPDLRGNALSTWVIAAVYGVAWGGYGLLLADRAIAFNGAIITVLASAVITGLVLGKRGLREEVVSTLTGQFTAISTATSQFAAINTPAAQFAVISTATSQFAAVQPGTPQMPAVSTDTASLRVDFGRANF